MEIFLDTMAPPGASSKTDLAITKCSEAMRLHYASHSVGIRAAKNHLEKLFVADTENFQFIVWHSEGVELAKQCKRMLEKLTDWKLIKNPKDSDVKDKENDQNARNIKDAKSKKKMKEDVKKSPWDRLKIELQFFDTSLTPQEGAAPISYMLQQIGEDEVFKPDACGLVQANPHTFSSMTKVQSSKPLAALVPVDTLEFKKRYVDFMDSVPTRLKSITYPVSDPLQPGKLELKPAVLVQMGTGKILPKKTKAQVAIIKSDTVELVGEFSEVWTPKWASLTRAEQKSKLDHLLAENTPINLEPYAFRKVPKTKKDCGVYECMFRVVPDKAMLFIACAGKKGTFVRQAKRHDVEEIKMVKIWIEKKCTLEEAYTLGRPSQGWLGLTFNERGLAIRIDAKPALVGPARLAIRPDDKTLDEFTAKVITEHEWTLQNVHIDVTFIEQAAALRRWGWTVLPIKRWVYRGITHMRVGASSFPPGAQGDPPQTVCQADTGPILITKVVYEDKAKLKGSPLAPPSSTPTHPKDRSTVASQNVEISKDETAGPSNGSTFAVPRSVLQNLDIDDDGMHDESFGQSDIDEESHQNDWFPTAKTNPSIQSKTEADSWGSTICPGGSSNVSSQFMEWCQERFKGIDKRNEEIDERIEHVSASVMSVQETQVSTNLSLEAARTSQQQWNDKSDTKHQEILNLLQTIALGAPSAKAPRKEE